MLATVMFTDIVGSTEQAAERGDREWKQILEQHHSRARSLIARFRGAGVHTGEVETVNAKVGGIAVSIGARVGASAGASEVLVSQTVKDLVAGSGLTFEDRGEHTLKGVPGTCRLYRTVD